MKRESREARVGLVVTVVPSESVGSDADQAVDPKHERNFTQRQLAHHHTHVPFVCHGVHVPPSVPHMESFTQDVLTSSETPPSTGAQRSNTDQNRAEGAEIQHRTELS